MTRLRSRRVLANVAIAIAVATATAAGVALASGESGGQAKPASTSGGTVLGSVSAAAQSALDRLVGAHTITQAQADAVQAQVDAGSVNPKTLVDSGTVSDAQMHAIAGVLDQVKRSFAG
jgi:hypothetical protein